MVVVCLIFYFFIETHLQFTHLYISDEPLKFNLAARLLYPPVQIDRCIFINVRDFLS